MKAAVFHGKGDLRVEEIPAPQAAGDGLLIEVKACGVCGTDLHIYEGAKGAAECTPPTVLGHEFAGVVAAVGSGVKGFRVGDRVAVDPNSPCGGCDFCRGGQPHFCKNLIGTGTTQNGGFAQLCAVKASQAYHIPDSLPFEQAAMAEPVSCCLHGVDLARIRPGGNAVIIGGGPIGLIILQLTKLAGAARIVMIEPIEEKRALALKLGAAAAVDPLAPGADLKKAIREAGIENADTVIECVGLRSTMRQAIDLAGNCATVVFFGLTAPDDEIPVRPFEVFQKELTITASFINPNTMGRAVACLAAGAVDVAPVIARTVPLAGINDVFDRPGLRRGGKVVILP